MDKTVALEFSPYLSVFSGCRALCVLSVTVNNGEAANSECVVTGLSVGTLCLFDRVECPRGAIGAGRDTPEGRSAYLLYAGTVPSVLEKASTRRGGCWGGILDEGGRKRLG